MDKIKTMRLRLSILPFSSPNVASVETEKPSVDKEGDPGCGGVKAGEGERGRPKESTRTPGGEQTLNFMSIVIIIVIVK